MKKIIIYSILFCVSFGAFSQTNENNENTKEPWEFDVTPYVWLAAVNGDISYLNDTAPVSAEFKDVLEDLNIGFFMHAEAKKGKWFIMGDIMYINISKEGSFDDGNLKTELEIKQTVAELAARFLASGQNRACA